VPCNWIWLYAVATKLWSWRLGNLCCLWRLAPCDILTASYIRNRIQVIDCFLKLTPLSCSNGATTREAGSQPIAVRLSVTWRSSISRRRRPSKFWWLRTILFCKMRFSSIVNLIMRQGYWQGGQPTLPHLATKYRRLDGHLRPERRVSLTGMHNSLLPNPNHNYVNRN